MIEIAALLAKKAVGVGIVGTVTVTGVEVTQDMVDTFKNFMLTSATQIEMGECHKVLLSHYIRDNKYPQGDAAVWNWFSENYDEGALAKLKGDGWDHPYQFVTPKCEIQSAGPDKKHDTRDDLRQPYPKQVKR